MVIMQRRDAIQEYMATNRAFLSRLFFVLWVLSLGTVCYLSLSPKVEVSFGFEWDDTICHALAYAWLSTLALLGFQRAWFRLVGVLLLIPFGIALEFVQQFVPGRHFSVVDMIANSIGVALALMIHHKLRNHAKADPNRERGLV
jgi:hypothetical protein